MQKGSDLGKQVLEAYLKDAASLPGRSPASTSRCNVDGDAKPERVALFGRDIVVLGPSFKGGTGYARLSLTQFADDKDVSELTARDVTETAQRSSSFAAYAMRRAPAGDTIDIEASSSTR